MRKKKTKEIDYSKERVVLSDILPYETPLIFSNRHFYNFLRDNYSEIVSTTLISDRLEHAKANYLEPHLSKTTNHLMALQMVKKLMFDHSNSKDRLVTKPFQYKTRHKEDDYRELSVIHPKNQLEIVKFYEKYKSLIIYYTSLSPYSLRKPHKLAKYTFFNDILHAQRRDSENTHGNAEQYDVEYENLKSYFSVKKYNNIHKFYESYQFHRAEKKYNNLYKFDISKCFDSIYTHTITWSLLNKEIVKNNIDDSRNTFGGEFDHLMQKLNFNETNGIVIGPELSRIFAEIILQKIDLNVFKAIRANKDEKECLIHKVDYEVFRYVDDYFVFYNSENTKNEIIKEFRIQLKEYKLSFNDSKNILYNKPIITAISIAKQKISDLFKDHLILKEKDGKVALIDTNNETKEENDEFREAPKSIYFTANHIITRFKIIISETGIEYKDIMNFSLAVLDKKVASLIKKYNKLGDVKYKEKVFLNAFLQVLDIAFFLYSVSPRVNSTIKICMIVEKIITFLGKHETNNHTEPFNDSNKHLVFKKIFDDILVVLQKNKSSQFIQVETLYLLICLSQLGRDYRLNPKLICEYFGIDIDVEGEYKCRHELNYFSITVLLFYMKDIKQYLGLKEHVKSHILDKYKNINQEDRKSNAELTLLLFDCLSCPYLDNNYRKTDAFVKYSEATTDIERNKYKIEFLKTRYSYKKKLLTLNGITENHANVIESRKYWFIKWTDFNFGLELESKKSQEVYG
jgi:hypothetical protein